jgi:hypothetical protein
VPEGEVILPVSGATVPPLVDLMHEAPTSTAYRGIRKVEVFLPDAQSSFTEEVSGDGAGNVYYKVRQVYGAPLSPDLFEILLDQRRRIAVWMRDPRVVDVDLFNANAIVVDLGTNPVVAGVPCLRLHVTSVNATPHDSYFEMSVDPVTGMTLSWQEYDWAGDTLLSVEYQSIAWTFDPTGLELTEPQLTHEPLDHTKPLAPQVDHPVLEPVLLPAGFQLVDASSTMFQEGLVTLEYVRLEYTDGMDRIVMLQTAPAGNFDGDGEPIGTPPNTLTNTPPYRPHGDAVIVEPFGSWNFVTGEIGSQEIILAGRVGERPLLDMLASSL